MLQNDFPIRIQVKTATYDVEHKAYRASLTTGSGRENKTHLFYDSKDVDFFIIKLFDKEIYYVIPFEDYEGIPMISFSPVRKKRAHNGKDNEVYRDTFHLISSFKPRVKTLSKKK